MMLVINLRPSKFQTVSKFLLILGIILILDFVAFSCRNTLVDSALAFRKVKYA